MAMLNNQRVPNFDPYPVTGTGWKRLLGRWPLAGPQRRDLESSSQISTRGYHTKMAIYSGFSH